MTIAIDWDVKPHPFYQTKGNKMLNAKIHFVLKSFILCDVYIFCGSRPPSGSMLLYNRNKVRHRKDNYCWKKRKDGKTIREDHMKLKVQGLEVPIVEQRFI